MTHVLVPLCAVNDLAAPVRCLWGLIGADDPFGVVEVDHSKSPVLIAPEEKSAVCALFTKDVMIPVK